MKNQVWFKYRWLIVVLLLVGIIVVENISLSSQKGTSQRVEAPVAAVIDNEVEDTLVLDDSPHENVNVPELLFDLDAVYEMNVDDLKDVFGIPKIDTEPRDLQVNILSEDQLAKEWNKTWEKEGFELIAFYDTSTREVLSFFLPTNSPAGATDDVAPLEERIGAEHLLHYVVEPVEAKGRRSLYTGISITPKKE